jgi:hypothetical protein
MAVEHPPMFRKTDGRKISVSKYVLTFNAYHSHEITSMFTRDTSLLPFVTGTLFPTQINAVNRSGMIVFG